MTKPRQVVPDTERHLIGYARVSTEEQNPELQTKALLAGRVIPDDLYVEKVSGAAKNRPRLAVALKACRPGDVFVVWKLDRLARSLTDLLIKMKYLEDNGVGFKSLTEAIDTTTPAGRLIMHVIGAIAEFERALIVESTKAGRAAIERGQQIGQPPKLTEEQLTRAQKMRTAGTRVEDIAKMMKVSKGTIYNNTHGLSRTRKKPSK